MPTVAVATATAEREPPVERLAQRDTEGTPATVASDSPAEPNNDGAADAFGARQACRHSDRHRPERADRCPQQEPGDEDGHQARHDRDHEARERGRGRRRTSSVRRTSRGNRRPTVGATSRPSRAVTGDGLAAARGDAEEAAISVRTPFGRNSAVTSR